MQDIALFASSPTCVSAWLCYLLLLKVSMPPAKPPITSRPYNINPIVDVKKFDAATGLIYNSPTSPYSRPLPVISQSKRTVRTTRFSSLGRLPRIPR